MLIILKLFLIAIGVIGIGFLIGFHELGHFLFCKLFGIRTPSFSIGMGPKIFSKKIGETQFSLSAIPLGGYVEIAGLEEVGQGEQKEAKRTDSHAFSTKPYYQKLLVLTGGIVFNLFFAYVAFIALSWMGMPKIGFLYPDEMPVIVKSIEENSSAAQAGLQPNDKIIGISYETLQGDTMTATELPVQGIPTFLKNIKELPNKVVTLTVQRDDKELQLPVTIGADAQGKGRLGVPLEVNTPITFMEPTSFIEGIKQGIHTANQTIIRTFEIFKSIFASRSAEGLGGPLAIIAEMIEGARKGGRIFLVLLALMSINLALLNIVPLPVLDGGQILFTTIETIIGRELPEKAKMAIQIICWVLLLGLFAVLTFWDIKRLFFK